MPSTTEQDQTFAAVRARLLARSGVTAIVGATSNTARIYAEDQVPQTPVFPYLLVEFLSGDDVQGAGTHRIATDIFMRVTAISNGPVDSTTRTLAYEADQALQGTSVQVSGGYVFSARRFRPWRRPLLQEGTNNRFGRTGGDYRYFVSVA